MNVKQKRLKMFIFGWMCLVTTIIFLIIFVVVISIEAIKSFWDSADIVTVLVGTILIMGLITFAIATVPFTIVLV